MITNDIIQLLTPIIVAVVGAVWTVLSYRIQQTYNRSQIYMAFRDKFNEFQLSLPTGINNRDDEGRYNYLPPKGTEVVYNRLIERYWWICFDEWFICCKQCRNCKSLWKKYYSIGVMDALERDDFIQAFVRLVRNKASFLGQDQEFAKEVARIYAIRHKDNLLPSDYWE